MLSTLGSDRRFASELLAWRLSEDESDEEDEDEGEEEESQDGDTFDRLDAPVRVAVSHPILAGNAHKTRRQSLQSGVQLLHQLQGEQQRVVRSSHGDSSSSASSSSDSNVTASSDNESQHSHVSAAVAAVRVIQRACTKLSALRLAHST